MSHLRKISNRDALTLDDMVAAYRKAKADCYFERTVCARVKFAEFEQDIGARLTALLKQVKSDGASVFARHLGTPRVIPKNLSIKPKPNGDGHSFFSDPRQAFKHALASADVAANFRIIGDFPVEMHVLSALWVNTAGHLFDARLGSCAYGSRLRRLRSAESSGAVGEYHIEALGSFQPYFEPYKRWRQNGFNAMRRALEDKQKIIALSLDLRAYYHLIDATFMKREGFRRGIEEAGGGPLILTEWETEATEGIADAMAAWSNLAASHLETLGKNNSTSSPPLGVPIGLSASAIAANVLLHKWDVAITRRVNPIFYGRYVDDMFLVLRDPGNIESSAKLMDALARNLDGLLEETLPTDEPAANARASRTIKFEDSYQGRSRLELQDGKRRAFFIEGQRGLDLLESIEKEIVSIASERRLMPVPDELDRSGTCQRE